MPQHTTRPDAPNPDDNAKPLADHIEENPPYRVSGSGRIDQFRKLLAELIARHLQADRQHPRKNRGRRHD
jgi:hypothetical protein